MRRETPFIQVPLVLWIPVHGGDVFPSFPFPAELGEIKISSLNTESRAECGLGWSHSQMQEQWGGKRYPSPSGDDTWLWPLQVMAVKILQFEAQDFCRGTENPSPHCNAL